MRDAVNTETESATAGTLNATPSLRSLGTARAETNRTCALEIVGRVLRRVELFAREGEYRFMFPDSTALTRAFEHGAGTFNPPLTNEEEYAKKGWKAFFDAVRDQMGGELKVDLNSGTVYAYHSRSGTLARFGRDGSMVYVESYTRPEFERMSGVDPLRRLDRSAIELAHELLETVVAKGLSLGERRGAAATFRNLAREFEEHAASLTMPARGQSEYAQRAHQLLRRVRDRELLVKADLLSDRLCVLDPVNEEFAMFGSDGRTLGFRSLRPADWRSVFGVAITPSPPPGA